VAAVAMFGAGMATNPYVSMSMISLSLAGLYAFKSPFWAVPTLFLSRSSAAVSIAVINSVGNLGGFVGPFAVGYIKGRGGSSTTGLLFLSALLVMSCIMAVAIRLREHDPDLPQGDLVPSAEGA
jgi:ACS family tartrate transporter-like MFS transporter